MTLFSKICLFIYYLQKLLNKQYKITDGVTNKPFGTSSCHLLLHLLELSRNLWFPFDLTISCNTCLALAHHLHVRPSITLDTAPPRVGISIHIIA